MTQKTLSYNPSIQVFIATDGASGLIDVSEDIIDFELDRVTNAVSTFSMTLNNRAYKYINGSDGNPVIETLNRIIVNMTRTVSIQVFSGYVTQVPIFTALPNAIQIVAKCTLKRLENTYWDSSIPEIRSKLLPGLISSVGKSGTYNDGGAAQGILNLLTEVVDWNANNAHIQALPPSFIDVVSREYKADASTLKSGLVTMLKQAFDGQGIIKGNSANASVGNNANVNTNYGWAKAVLEAANLNTSVSNINFMVNWMAAEGHSPDKWWIGGQDLNLDVNNPFNILPPTNFPDLTTAAKVTGQNIASPYYTNNIYAALKPGNSSFETMQTAVYNSKWGTKQGIADNNLPVVAVPGSSASKSNDNSYQPSAYACAAAAVAAAVSQEGLPYIHAGESPGTGFDCSGLTQWAYAQAGVILTEHLASAQFEQFPNLKGTGTPIAGDLLFWGPPDYNTGQFGVGHVSICKTGTDANGNNGTMIQASHPGAVIAENKFSINDPSFVGYNRPWADGATALTTGTTNTGNGTSGQNSANSSGLNGSNPGLFNTIYTLPQWNPIAITTYGSPQGFMMDEPVLNSVSQLSAASFRSFQSLPNGDFVAWFPDYFGIYKTPAVMDIYNIEIIDLSIYHNDDYLTTHVAVAGDTTQLGQAVSVADWLETAGIISVQTPNVMNILLGLGSDASEQFNAPKFLQKYGMRPYVSEQPLIANHLLEFSYAMYTFMQQWAYQYSTQVKFTFMPELYPGMRIRFPELTVQNGTLELYVLSVTHTGSMTNGYSTEAVVTCPSLGNGQLLYDGYNLNNFITNLNSSQNVSNDHSKNLYNGPNYMIPGSGLPPNIAPKNDSYNFGPTTQPL